ncbi:hypothetical protein ACGF5M_02005 [Gemmatimonadota bacterium]
MSVSLSFYALRARTSVMGEASATGVFLQSIIDAFRQASTSLKVEIRWLDPAESTGGRVRGWISALRWVARERKRILRDQADILFLVYPKLPIMSHSGHPFFLSLTERTLRSVLARHGTTGQRLVVLVEDLPLEMAKAREAVGEPAADLDMDRIRAIESLLLTNAHLLVVPSGFVEPLRVAHGLDEERVRTFRRNVYPSDAVGTTNGAGVPNAAGTIDSTRGLESLPDVERGAVDFFYSGSVEPWLASDFKRVVEVLASVPEARLHVCGPGEEEVRAWASEVGAANVTHYGILDRPTHDWLARQCQIGLILYPAENPYFRITPTMKYTAYLANGLAVLSTDLAAVADNVRLDGVGRALPMEELILELNRWARDPEAWAGYKAKAEVEAEVVRSGEEMRGWIAELAREGDS